MNGYTTTIYRPASGATYVAYYKFAQLVVPTNNTTLVLFGTPTLPADLAGLGAKSYGVTVEQLGVGLSGQKLTVDIAARTVSGTVTVVPANDTIRVALAFTGVLDSGTGRFTGTVASVDGVYAGTFQGVLYGPGATEVGLVFNFESKSFVQSVGVLTGKAG